MTGFLVCEPLMVCTYPNGAETVLDQLNGNRHIICENVPANKTMTLSTFAYVCVCAREYIVLISCPSRGNKDTLETLERIFVSYI